MNKSLVFTAGMCISNVLFFVVSSVTGGRPIARAVISGIGILCFFLMLNFAPKPDSERETNYEKFVFGLEIIIMILAFVAFIGMIGMIQG